MWQPLLCLVLSSCSHYDTGALKGSVVHVTSYLSTPNLIRREAASTANVSGNYEGFVVDLLDAMAGLLGCRFVVREVRDNRYGAMKVAAATNDPRGEWTGMIGELMRGEADLAVADLRATAERSLVVDFSQPILDNRLVAVANRQVTVRTLAELAAVDDAVFLVLEGSSTARFFQSTEDPVYKQIAEKIG
jgi:ABC-type amino acid transport substrate-binding protein